MADTKKDAVATRGDLDPDVLTGGQEANAAAVAKAKEADAERQMTDEQRKQLDEATVKATLAGGTKVAGPKRVIDTLTTK